MNVQSPFGSWRGGVSSRLCAAALLVFASTVAAHAQTTYYWDSNGATSGFGNTAGTWGTSAFWSTSSAGTAATANSTITSVDTVNFGTATLNYGTSNVGVAAGGVTTGGIVMGAGQTTAISLGTAGNAITIHGGGITKNSGSGALTMVSPLTLGAAQSWTNNSANALNINAGVTLSGNLTIDGSGNTVLNTASAIIGGTGDLIKNGSGNLGHGGNTPAHAFTGNVTVNGGSISSQSQSWLTGRNVLLTNGYIGGRFGSGFTWTGGLGTGANQIQITGGTSGFSGEGNTGSTFQIGTALSTLKWGATGENGATGFFNPTVFLANGTANMNTNGKGSLNNGIDLNGTNRTITSTQTTDGATNSGFTISGVISNSIGTAGFTKTGVGNLILNGANTYNGGTTISGGILTINSGSNLGANLNTNNASLAAGTRLNLSAAGNSGANQTITLTSTAGSLSVLALGYNGALNAATAQADTNGGVIAINSVVGYNQNLSSRLTGNNFFLGGIGTTSTFTGAAANVAPGAGSLYRLGGGGGTISFNTTNLFTGANAVQIGSTATNGTGTVVFGASQDFTGVATVNSGSTLSLTASQAFTNTVTVNSGAAISTSNTISVAAPITNAGTMTLNGATTFAGLVTTSTGMTLSSTATQTFNGGLTLTSGTVSFVAGTTNIAGSGLLTIATSTLRTTGTVNIANDVRFNAGSNLSLDRPAGSTPNFNFNGNVELAGNSTITSGISTTSANVVIGGNISDPLGDFTLTLTGTSFGQFFTLSGNNSGWSGGLIKNSGATLNLNSANASGTGNLALSAGTTNINHASFGTGALNLSGGTIDNTSGGAITLANNNVFNFTANTNFAGSNSLSNGSGNFTINGTRTITVSANRLTLGGNQTTVVAGGIVKAGAGTLALLGSGVQTGAATISAGVLEVGVINNAGTAGGSSLGNVTNAAANLLMANGTTLRYVGSTNATTDRAFTINGTAAGHGATIESSGNGTLSYSGGPALAYGTTNQTRSLTLAGTNTGNNTFGKIIANNGTGATSLVKSGAGRWILNQANTYTGGTTASNGTLVVNNTTGSGTGTGAVSIGAIATLGGNGTISGATTIDGFHTPGNSPGIQTFGGGLTYNGTSTLTWELIDNTAAALDRGVDYDGVNVTGGAFSLVTGAEIDLAFGGTVDFLDSFWGTDQEWLVVDLSGGATASDTNLFTIGSITGGANYSPALGTFGVERKPGSNAADSVYLTWVAVPEPSTIALATCGLIGLGLAVRRRFHQKA